MTVNVNPSTGFLTTQANRMTLLTAVNVKQIFTQVFSGRATIANQAYPAHMMPAGNGLQNIPYQPSALSNCPRRIGRRRPHAYVRDLAKKSREDID